MVNRSPGQAWAHRQNSVSSSQSLGRLRTDHLFVPSVCFHATDRTYAPPRRINCDNSRSCRQQWNILRDRDRSPNVQRRKFARNLNVDRFTYIFAKSADFRSIRTKILLSNKRPHIWIHQVRDWVENIKNFQQF